MTNFAYGSVSTSGEYVDLAEALNVTFVTGSTYKIQIQNPVKVCVSDVKPTDEGFIVDTLKPITYQHKGKTFWISTTARQRAVVNIAEDGGSAVNNQDLIITENGLYSAGEGYTGLGSVTVNVQPTLENTEITENGTYTADENYDGLGEVTVNVDTVNNVDLTITPTTSVQTITPDANHTGFGSVEVNAVTSDIDSNITASNIKKDISILGVTGTYEGEGGGSSSKYGLTVDSILGDINSNGILQKPTQETNLLFNGVIDIGNTVLMNFAFASGGSAPDRALNNIKSVSFPNLTTISGQAAMKQAFMKCTGIITTDLSNLTTVSGNSAMQDTFRGCTGLTSVGLSNLTTVSGNSAMSSAFCGCTGLTSVDLSSLTTVSGNMAMYNVFESCTGLTSVDLSNLTTVSVDYAISQIFYNCTGLTNVDLSSLTTVSGKYTMSNAFYGCTGLTNLSFPALTSTGFGSYTSQFSDMLKNVTGCSVHFPSNLQSVIGSWSDVTSGFGGTNTTVLFDLPATS